ncbi:MAG: hypothetical protein ACFFCS_01020 [Candidatus Hodarchaeota archaeon]
MFDDIGGFLFTPGKYSKSFFDKAISIKTILKNLFYCIFLSVFFGVALMFMLLYPEIWFYEDSVKEGLNLFVLPLGDPLLLLGAFGLGVAIVLILNYWLVGWLVYGFELLFQKIRELTGRVENLEKKVTFHKFMAAQGVAMTPLGLMGAFMTFWLYFFEKVNYAKIFFPFVDFTVPVIMFFAVIGFFLVWKWYIQSRIYRELYRSNKRSIVPIAVEIALIIVALVVIWYVGNLVAPQFA